MMQRTLRRSLSMMRVGQQSVGASAYVARSFSTQSNEVELLKQLLADAKSRQAEAEKAEIAAAAPTGGSGGPKFNIATFNAISPVGLGEFDPDLYYVKDMKTMLEEGVEPHCIMLRSHKLQLDEVPSSVRCIARCGAGTNNVPSIGMAKRGIPVFNTPGANANAVKEAVVCGLLLASRGIYEGIRHTQDVIYPESKEHSEAAARIEKDKKLFVGRELTGKTLGVIGLGHIGGKVMDSALALGMKTIGFDPSLSLDAAWRLPGDRMERASTLDDLLAKSDYVSLNVPYMPATHHLLGAEQLSKLKPNASIINFSRGELVDSASLRALYDSGEFSGKYVSDFADEHLQGHPKMIMLPHLGASTAEAEENSSAMAAKTIKSFLTSGTVVNAVNFPSATLSEHIGESFRLCVVNHNTPGTLGKISTLLGEMNVNIAQQLNVSKDEVAYTVVDADNIPDPEVILGRLGEIPGVMSARCIGTGPGSSYTQYPNNHRSVE